MEIDKIGRHSVRNLTSLQIVVRVTFKTEHIQVSREHHLQDVNLSNGESYDNARVVMSGKCRVTESLPPTSNAPQLHMPQPDYQSMVWIHQHVTFHFFHNQRQWNGQRATGNLFPP